MAAGRRFFKNKPKYKNRKVNIDGVEFDSMKEYWRYLELKHMQAEGKITDLQRQVKYILIPAQREPDTVGKRGGIKKGRLLEREVAYYADFVYRLTDGGVLVVEDTKGMRTTEYIIKRKLMLYMHKIRIKEV